MALIAPMAHWALALRELTIRERQPWSQRAWTSRIPEPGVTLSKRAWRGTGRLQYLSVWLSRNITQQVPRLPLTQLHRLFTLKPISRGQNQLLGYSTATASNSCAHRP